MIKVSIIGCGRVFNHYDNDQIKTLKLFKYAIRKKFSQKISKIYN